MSGRDFEGQRESEEVILVFRRHILTTQRGWWFFIVMTLLGFLPMLIWRDEDRMIFVWLGFIILGLLGWLYVYMLWYFSIYIVTNQRLRQVRQKSLFKRSVVDLSLLKIESISCDVRGVRETMFGYGTLLVQTMAGDLVLSSVSKPEKIYNELQNVIEELNRGEGDE